MYDHGNTDDAIPDDAVTMAAERLRAARRYRALERERARVLIDAMEREAQRRLGAIFSDDDPITGRPVCLLIKSEDRMGDDYERESPRAIPDSHNRLTIEVLGRVLVVDLDDFGRLQLDGLPGIDGLRSATMSGEDVVFLHGERDAQRVTFASLLTQLLERVTDDERNAVPAAPHDVTTVA